MKERCGYGHVRTDPNIERSVHWHRAHGQPRMSSAHEYCGGLLLMSTDFILYSAKYISGPCGATVERLTPDQKGVWSNLVGGPIFLRGTCAVAM